MTDDANDYARGYRAASPGGILLQAARDWFRPLAWSRHGFARPENRIKFYAAAEAFLAKYLGGRAEPAAHLVDQPVVTATTAD